MKYQPVKSANDNAQGSTEEMSVVILR